MAKNVITENMSFAASAGLAELNNDSLYLLASGIVTAASKAHDQLEWNLNNNTTQLNAEIDALRIQLKEVAIKADILDSLEVAQVEAMVKSVFESPAFLQAISAVGVVIDGTNYSVASVVKAMATTARVVEESIIRDAEGFITGIKLKLSDGMYAEFFSVTKNVGETEASYEFKTDNWHGVPASIVATYSNMGKKISGFGMAFIVPSWIMSSVSHLVIDLTDQFTVIRGGVVANLDFNGDGMVGVQALAAM